MTGTLADHQQGALSWIVKPRRGRFEQAMDNPRLGKKFQLAHRADALFEPSYAQRLDPGMRREQIEAELRARGAPEECCLIVEYDMTPRLTALRDALEAYVFDDDAALISCIPGKLGLFSDEAPGDQWLLSGR